MTASLVLPVTGLGASWRLERLCAALAISTYCEPRYSALHLKLEGIEYATCKNPSSGECLHLYAVLDAVIVAVVAIAAEPGSRALGENKSLMAVGRTNIREAAWQAFRSCQQ